MRFLIDMPLSPDLAAWLRQQNHDAVHVSELNLFQAPDLDLLAHAKREQRTLVTADLDYPRLLALAQHADPSLILFRDGNWSDTEIVTRMAEILPELAGFGHCILVVERDRVRRRALPIG